MLQSQQLVLELRFFDHIAYYCSSINFNEFVWSRLCNKFEPIWVYGDWMIHGWWMIHLVKMLSLMNFFGSWFFFPNCVSWNSCCTCWCSLEFYNFSCFLNLFSKLCFLAICWLSNHRLWQWPIAINGVSSHLWFFVYLF